MNKNNDHYFEIYLAEKLKDNRKKLDFFSEMTNCLFKLTNNLFAEKIKIKYHQNELEKKMFRFGISNKTIEKIIEGNKFNLIENTVSVIDIDSLYSITRMQIEVYQILYYLIFDDVSDELKEFRYNIYMLHGIQKQLNFEISENFVDEEGQLTKLNVELNELICLIKNSSYYNLANEKLRKEYLNPRYAKIDDTKSIFQKSGIKKSRIDQMWSIYSNYAHAEYIGDRQHNYRINNPNSVNDVISLVIDINKILTSKLIWFLKEEFVENKIKYESLSSKQKIHIETWMKL